MTPPRRIPTKKELERLQRLYKTDERIAERLGNVEPYLVGYWRRKRNVPQYSAPKFSEDEIRVLWERLGDDDNCGAELGISRAAFYNWRRRYGITEKPAFLKLEQMEFQFPGKEYSAQRARNYGKRSATHKLLWEKRDGRRSAVSEEIAIVPDLLALTGASRRALSASGASDNPGAPGAPGRSDALGLDPSTIALGLDAFCVTDGSSGALADAAELRQWAIRFGVTQVSSAHDGSFWETLAAKGALLPGKIIACERGQERFAGALGALGWGLAESEISRLVRSGEICLRTPAVTRVILTGKRYSPISATDITLLLALELARENTAETVVEFCGKSLSGFPVFERQTFCAVGSLGVARSALVPFDSVTRKYCAASGSWPYTGITADNDADYEHSFQFNIEQAQPMVARKRGSGAAQDTAGKQPTLALENSPGESAAPAAQVSISSALGSGVSLHTSEELSGAAVDVVFIGGSPGGHFEQLRQAAEKLRGKQVHENIALFVSPVSRHVYLQALKKGIIRQFIESGAVVLNFGIDSNSLPLFGVAQESIVATTSIEARYSILSRQADRYIVSPATAAAVALSGQIIDHRGL